ncbi:hypothetical protein KGF54_005023 [Candida jiufengensis]|uniref:uncharacterized protein n=1 Tax=Candida jiufengensis TaxID=497108 RepID=UPI00222548F0|nr:uncharacterized protein KGF54_005023 [Candida jiufengensis]KAI5951948.1 hypothetical protein KGF54_005023 [Candida jiufengensis]
MNFFNASDYYMNNNRPNELTSTSNSTSRATPTPTPTSTIPASTINQNEPSYQSSQLISSIPTSTAREGIQLNSQSRRSLQPHHNQHHNQHQQLPQLHQHLQHSINDPNLSTERLENDVAQQAVALQIAQQHQQQLHNQQNSQLHSNESNTTQFQPQLQSQRSSSLTKTSSNPYGQQLQPSPTSPTISSSTNPTKKHRVNKPGKKFGAKRRSWVWQFFINPDSDETDSAECQVCKKTIQRLPSDKGSPKKLSEHLKTHKITKELIVQQQSTTEGSSQSKDNWKSKHSKSKLNQISEAQDEEGKSASDIDYEELDDEELAKYEKKPYSATRFHKHVLQFLMENKLPISIINSNSFKQLVFDLRPSVINDINALTNLYGSILKVKRFGDGTGGDGDDNDDNEESLIEGTSENVMRGISDQSKSKKS